jgi:hypothetical protein
VNGAQLTETPLSEFAGDERWQLVNRIAGSPPFQRSARLRTFLLYVVEQSLAGKTGRLHEHDIGCAIFNREPGYNPVDDNIVRVHARQLRIRLDTYFQSHGKDEKLEVVIPKGTYVPEFRPRGARREKPEEPQSVDLQIAEVPLTEPEPAPATDHAVALTNLVAGRRLPWILCALLALTCIWLGFSPLWKTPQPGRASTPPPRLLAAVMDPARPTIVVAPDSGIPIFSDLFGRTVGLADYLNPAFPESLLPSQADASTRKMFELMDRRAMVTFSTAVAMSRIVAASERSGRRLHLRFAHHLNAREFDEGNFILIGNSAANPWAGLYEKNLNFRTAWDPDSGRTIFRNQTPREGEMPVYEAKRIGEQVIDSYSVIALIRRQTGERRSNVLIIEGLNSESTEAAADFVCDFLRTRDFIPSAKPNDPPFEILLHLRSAGGAVSESKVISSRP